MPAANSNAFVSLQVTRIFTCGLAGLLGRCIGSLFFFLYSLSPRLLLRRPLRLSLLFPLRTLASSVASRFFQEIISAD
jgi:hypothetical protein